VGVSASTHAVGERGGLRRATDAALAPLGRVVRAGHLGLALHPDHRVDGHPGPLGYVPLRMSGPKQNLDLVAFEQRQHLRRMHRFASHFR
jgi:hypothetical protein